jgi:hemoglobin-like flavoprotein
MQEHAKSICEALTYYLCIHEENKFLLPAIRDIAEQHVRFHICT